MFSPTRNKFVLISVGLLCLTQSKPSEAARYALLIGNDHYQEVPALRNAGADATAMTDALRKAGYTTTLVKDRTLKQMKDDIREFKAHVKGGDEVILFYSGHGVQIDAMNYLLPVDVRADTEDQVKDDALPLSKVLDDLREQKPILTLAVVDACRDNPFKSKGRAIGGRGLTGVGGANGQMVIYSAGEGQQALDSLSENDPVKNGVFTRVFIKEMEKPGVSIDRVARKVREEVNTMALSVNHQQVPAIYDQVIGQFYFYDKEKEKAKTIPALSQSDSSSGPDSVEIIFWKSVKDSRDVGELKAYLDKYPNGLFAGLAQARIASIEHSKKPAAVAVDKQQAAKIAAQAEKAKAAEAKAAAIKAEEAKAEELKAAEIKAAEAKAMAAKAEEAKIAAAKEDARLAEEKAKAAAEKEAQAAAEAQAAKAKEEEKKAIEKAAAVTEAVSAEVAKFSVAKDDAGGIVAEKIPAAVSEQALIQAAEQEQNIAVDAAPVATKKKPVGEVTEPAPSGTE